MVQSRGGDVAGLEIVDASVRFDYHVGPDLGRRRVAVEREIQDIAGAQSQVSLPAARLVEEAAEMTSLGADEAAAG